MTQGTREIARVAVRRRLAEVAIDVFRRDGFDRVTIADVAAEAGVSRSTFQRYFPTKEDVFLEPIEEQTALVEVALRERPAGEDDWTALRRALDALIAPQLADPATALDTARVIQQTPVLRARTVAQRVAWAPRLASALAERHPGQGSDLIRLVRAAAAMNCVTLVVERWVDSHGERDFGDLLDEAFTAFRG
ncbi:TetR/AcrR family transcriptional regulator [Actinoplanes couchii]|uniref:TetR family transcriptional regulator n=1 Tax=Actinoplanes couchii TaxID=403638 RepID=A0ABQ3XFS1_9ACTN|nr:TetR family transcriptional regulator [Actinoplanes couchii]MDR6321691.1 AcrR family transcriptional regulator [Actinoplanes couchii]GID57353.1 TetR family transcriptional regulator [Actinoplanes couchii]